MYTNTMIESCSKFSHCFVTAFNKSRLISASVCLLQLYAKILEGNRPLIKLCLAKYLFSSCILDFCLHLANVFFFLCVSKSFTHISVFVCLFSSISSHNKITIVSLPLVKWR